MYIKLNIDDVLLKENILNHYKLCYISNIPETIYDDTPETKLFKQTEEFKLLEKRYKQEMNKALEETGHFTPNFNDPYFTCQVMREYPNPEYIEGKATLFAYFTPRDLDDQWGDDWDNVPYDCNAEKPYDDGEEIIIIPFHIDSGLPVDWTNGYNCAYSVKDINQGAIAWVYDRYKGICIHAGTNPYEFIKKLKLGN